jgi:hypothetical protein
LSKIAEGVIDSSKVKCYLISKMNRDSLYKNQEINENGQIAGGIKDFIETQLEDLSKFLGANK